MALKHCQGLGATWPSVHSTWPSVYSPKRQACGVRRPRPKPALQGPGLSGSQNPGPEKQSDKVGTQRKSLARPHPGGTPWRGQGRTLAFRSTWPRQGELPVAGGLLLRTAALFTGKGPSVSLVSQLETGEFSSVRCRNTGDWG